MADSEIVVGDATYADGNKVIRRGGKFGEGMVSQLRGPYAELASRGKVFIAHNVAAQALSAALSTTYTGLMLSNPASSLKEFHLLMAGFAETTAATGLVSKHLIGAYSATAVTHTTPLAAPGIQCTRLGASGSVANVDSAATIPTPNYIMALYGGQTSGNIATTGQIAMVDIGGSIIIPPGAFIGIGALLAATGFSCLMWAELPIQA